MAVLPLQGSSCFRPKAEPNFPDLPHTPGSCRKWRQPMFQHFILLLWKKYAISFIRLGRINIYAGLETYSLTKILTIRYSVEILAGATFYSFLVCVTGLGSLVLPWDGSSCCPVMEELPSQGRPPLHGSWIQLIIQIIFLRSSVLYTNPVTYHHKLF